MMPTETFTTQQAARLAGFKSVSMIDYLCRSGVLVPSRRSSPGRGRSRLYTWDDLIYLRVLNKLLEKGLPVRGLKKALKAAKKISPRFHRDTKPLKYLITDGKDVWLRQSESEIIRVIDGQLEFAFILDLHQVHKEVTDAENRSSIAATS